MSRPGLYVIVIIGCLNSCSANEKASKALALLEKKFPDAVQQPVKSETRP